MVASDVTTPWFEAFPRSCDTSADISILTVHITKPDTAFICLFQRGKSPLRYPRGHDHHQRPGHGDTRPSRMPQSIASFLILLLAFIALVSARPEPAALFQHQHPHQVGFVIPPSPSPPYGKALPASSSLSSSRHWEWTHWLQDAKQTFKSIFGRPSKHHKARPGNADDERNVSRFDDDIVLRVNITSLADRKDIIAIAEVSPFAITTALIVEHDPGYLVHDSIPRRHPPP